MLNEKTGDHFSFKDDNAFFFVMKISMKPEVMNEKELLTLNPTVVVNAINVRLWESKMTHVSP